MSTDLHKKLKFLFITADRYPPFRVDVAVLFGSELASRGHEIHWIMQSEQVCMRGYTTTWEGGKAWVGKTDIGVTRLARVRKHFYAIMQDMMLFRLVRAHRYDFIQVKDKFIAAIFAIIATKRSRTRFFYWLSFPFPEASLYDVQEGTARYRWLYYLRGKIQKFLLYRVILRAADHIFVQSEQMKRDIAAMGIPESEMTPVPMGIALEMFPESHVANHGNTHDAKTVLYLGTMARARKIDFVVRVCKRVSELMPDTQFIMVGGSENPDDVDMLKEEARRLGIMDRILFTGMVSQEKALDYVRKATVCLSPFYPTPILNSTSPTKLIEYMAMGKPVVANDHPEQRLVIEESGAGLCVPYDEAAFAQAVVTLLRDPARSAEMGICGRRYAVARRSYDRIADMVEGEYLRIMGYSVANGTATTKDINNPEQSM